jgi:hypothetical protein
MSIEKITLNPPQDFSHEVTRRDTLNMLLYEVMIGCA